MRFDVPEPRLHLVKQRQTIVHANKAAVAEWNCRDGGVVFILGHDSGEDVRKLERIFEPLLRRPVGDVDMALHFGAMKLSVRKAVEVANPQVGLVESLLECRQPRGEKRLICRKTAKPQSDVVGPVLRDGTLDCRDGSAKRLNHLLECFAGMDV